MKVRGEIPGVLTGGWSAPAFVETSPSLFNLLLTLFICSHRVSFRKPLPGRWRLFD